MNQAGHRRFTRLDILWLVFLAGLAALKTQDEFHKELILLAIGLFQIFEHRFLGLVRERGKAYSVLIKIGLATLLVAHTGGINSRYSYYLIYGLPVATAAMFYEIWATLGWTALASAAYCSNLVPLLPEYQLTRSGATELAIRNLFFFLVAILINRFVTETRRQAEQLRETNRRLQHAEAEARRSERLAALGQLTAGLAHELRNPLGVIKASAETLLQKLPPQDGLAQELAGYIASEVNRLNTIVSRFLDFARPHALEKHLEEVPPLVERALKAAADHWPGSNIKIERQMESGLPLIPLDAALVEQVFTNLVFNAYEAMGGAEGELRVRIAAVNSEGRRGMEVTFEDTGPGVPPEQQDQIFNPFFTTKPSGVGLGLSVVSKIVDDHGGSIRIQAKTGKGASFRVFLPA
jgi:signal transduction histidine kinase